MTLDANTKTARNIASLAVFAVAIVHSCMNAAYGYSMGTHDFERYLFASFGVGTDICKVFALAFASYAWAKGYKVKALGCLVVWGVTVAYSATAALGFAALTRDTVVASRSAETDDYRDKMAERKRLSRELEQARVNPLFNETYACTTYKQETPLEKKHETWAERQTRLRSQFCSTYTRAAKGLEAIKPELHNSTATEADPQTAIMASMLGLPKGRVAMGMAVFLALVAEIVSSLGTWTFSRSIRRPDAEESAQRRARRGRPKLVVAN